MCPSESLTTYSQSLILTATVSFPTKIFNFRLDQKCFLKKVSISDKISLSSAKLTVATTMSAGSPPRPTSTSACSIKKCTRTKPFRFSQSYSAKSARIGQTLSHQSKLAQTPRTKVKSRSTTSSKSAISTELSVSQRKKLIIFSKLFLELKEATILDFDSTWLGSTIKSSTSFLKKCTTK